MVHSNCHCCKTSVVRYQCRPHNNSRFRVAAGDNSCDFYPGQTLTAVGTEDITTEVVCTTYGPVLNIGRDVSVQLPIFTIIVDNEQARAMARAMAARAVSTQLYQNGTLEFVGAGSTTVSLTAVSLTHTRVTIETPMSMSYTFSVASDGQGPFPVASGDVVSFSQSGKAVVVSSAVVGGVETNINVPLASYDFATGGTSITLQEGNEIRLTPGVNAFISLVSTAQGIEYTIGAVTTVLRVSGADSVANLPFAISRTYTNGETLGIAATAPLTIATQQGANGPIVELGSNALASIPFTDGTTTVNVDNGEGVSITGANGVGVTVSDVAGDASYVIDGSGLLDSIPFTDGTTTVVVDPGEGVSVVGANGVGVTVTDVAGDASYVIDGSALISTIPFMDGTGTTTVNVDPGEGVIIDGTNGIGVTLSDVAGDASYVIDGSGLVSSIPFTDGTTTVVVDPGEGVSVVGTNGVGVTVTDVAGDASYVVDGSGLLASIPFTDGTTTVNVDPGEGVSITGTGGVTVAVTDVAGDASYVIDGSALDTTFNISTADNIQGPDINTQVAGDGSNIRFTGSGNTQASSTTALDGAIVVTMSQVANNLLILSAGVTPIALAAGGSDVIPMSIVSQAGIVYNAINNTSTIAIDGNYHISASANMFNAADIVAGVTGSPILGVAIEVDGVFVKHQLFSIAVELLTQTVPAVGSLLCQAEVALVAGNVIRFILFSGLDTPVNLSFGAIAAGYSVEGFTGTIYPITE